MVEHFGQIEIGFGSALVLVRQDIIVVDPERWIRDLLLFAPVCPKEVGLIAEVTIIDGDLA
jgi:hypothetical protein